jgi:hypothetical protein
VVGSQVCDGFDRLFVYRPRSEFAESREEMEVFGSDVNRQPSPHEIDQSETIPALSDRGESL